MTRLSLTLPPESVHGAHRVRLLGQADPAAWTRALRQLALRLADLTVIGAWDPHWRLDVVASETASGGAVAYLVGSLDLWRSHELAGLDNPALVAVARELTSSGGRLDRVECESRALDTDFYRRISSHDWPWPFHAADSLVDEVVPVGAASGAQLRALADMMEIALREDRVSDPRAWIDGERVRLSAPIPPGRVVELTFLWWQICWVEMNELRLGMAHPEDRVP